MLCPSCQASNADGADRCFSCGHVFAATRVLTRGSVVAGRYEILAALGQGGMGTVYRAHDRLLDESVAIKVLRADVARDPDTARRFQSEIKLARRVSHRNVCRIHEYGEDQGLRYISMEFIEGADLRQTLREHGALAVDAAFDAALQVAEGLAAIHDVGVIHRDLKTPNIMRAARGVLKLMDFGIAKEWGVEGATATGLIVGTPEYMSPEQARGETIDFRSDIYALGVVVFEIFTGRVPFRSDTPLGTILKHLQEPPPLDGPQAASIPGAVKPVLWRALAKRPGERYEAVAEMAQALRDARAALAAEPVSLTAPTAPRAVPTLVPPPARAATAVAGPTAVAPVAAVPRPTAPGSARAQPPSPPAMRQPSRVWPFVLLGGALAAAGVVAVAVVIVLGRLSWPSASPSPAMVEAREAPVTPPPAAAPGPPSTHATRAAAGPPVLERRPPPSPRAAAATLPPATLEPAPTTLPQPVEPAAPAPPAVPAEVLEAMEALRGRESRGRWTAAAALGNLGPAARPAVPALVEALEDRSEEVRWRSAEALGKVGVEARAAVPALVRALSDRDGLVRTEAAKALGRMAGAAREAVPALAAGLSSPEVTFRREAAKALARVGPGSEVLDPLVKGLKDKDKFVRAECARALGRIGPGARAAVPALTSALKDDLVVSREAQAALESIGR